MACRLYIITVLVETTIDLAIEGDLLLRVHAAGEADEDQSDKISGLALKMPVYLGIFALAQYVYRALPSAILCSYLADAAYSSSAWPLTPFMLGTLFNSSPSRERLSTPLSSSVC